MIRKLQWEHVEEIRRRYLGGERQIDLAAEYKVSGPHVSSICNGKRRVAPPVVADPRKMFLSHVVAGLDGHWIWTGCIDGRFMPWFACKVMGRRALNANRAAWMLFRQPRTELSRSDSIVRTCGRRDCVAPFHLKKLTARAA